MMLLRTKPGAALDAVAPGALHSHPSRSGAVEALQSRLPLLHVYLHDPPVQAVGVEAPLAAHVSPHAGQFSIVLRGPQPASVPASVCASLPASSGPASGWPASCPASGVAPSAEASSSTCCASSGLESVPVALSFSSEGGGAVSPVSVTSSPRRRIDPGRGIPVCAHDRTVGSPSPSQPGAHACSVMSFRPESGAAADGERRAPATRGQRPLGGTITPNNTPNEVRRTRLE